MRPSALRRCWRRGPTIAERVVETGTRGEGGDRTLMIDALAEDAVFAELRAAARRRRALHGGQRGAREVDFGGDGTLVVIDPIDGSLNAKRGLPHHALSIAVADGADDGRRRVRLRARLRAGRGVGRAARRRRHARRRAARPGRSASGAGAPTASSSSSASSPPTRAGCCGRPKGSREVAHRLRAIGTIAVSLCQVAAGAVRRDGDLEALPRGRRRRGAADRARGRRAGRVHRLRRPARRAAGSRAALAGGRRAHGGRAAPSSATVPDWTE